METLRDVWNKLQVVEANKDTFYGFLLILSISLTREESNTVFDMLDLENKGKLTFSDIRILLNMTKVYDKEKYPRAWKTKSYKFDAKT